MTPGSWIVFPDPDRGSQNVTMTGMWESTVKVCLCMYMNLMSTTAYQLGIVSSENAVVFLKYTIGTHSNYHITNSEIEYIYKK